MAIGVQVTVETADHRLTDAQIHDAEGAVGLWSGRQAADFDAEGD